MQKKSTVSLITVKFSVLYNLKITSVIFHLFSRLFEVTVRVLRRKSHN